MFRIFIYKFLKDNVNIKFDLKLLKNDNIKFEIKNVYNYKSIKNSNKLTLKQEKVLSLAYKLGYFDFQENIFIRFS
jgi:predicted DNA binding protein